MARAFASASSQKLQHDNAAVSDVPLTMACWMRTATAGTSQACMTIGRRTAAAQRYQLFFRNTNRIAGFCQNGAGTQTTTFEDSSGVNISTNTWYHGAVVFNTTTDRTIYRDGGSSTNNTTTVTVGTVDTTMLGTRFDGGSFGLYLNGQIAEAGIWNVALTAGEIAQLAKGVCPLMVRPEALVAYWPLYGNSSPEDDWINDFDLTITGATKAAHPRVVYPAVSKILLPQTAAGPTYTLTADHGSFTLTGQAANLVASRVITAEHGTFALSGQAAGLQASRKLVVDHGSFTLSGQNVALQAGRKLLADHGAFTLTGQDVGFTYTPAGATYSLTAETGIFTLSGQAAALAASRVITAEHGSFTLNGQDAQFSYSGDVQAVQPAGRIKHKKKRWAVEHDGELVEFTTAQAAIGWLGRQNKKIKKLGQQVRSAAPKTEPPAPIPFAAITFDGVKLNKMMVDGEKALDRIRTMRQAEIEMVERHIQELQEEESLIMRFIELLD